MQTAEQIKQREAKDAVTVGQIRQRLMATLDREIAEMAKMIKEDGYHRRGEINKFLNEVIGRTLTPAPEPGRHGLD